METVAVLPSWNTQSRSSKNIFNFQSQPVLTVVRPKLVVSGHVHGAHGIKAGEGEHEGTLFVNAAMCGAEKYVIGWEPVVVQI